MTDGGLFVSWIRHLPSVIASSLLFGFIGTPLGSVIFFAIARITTGKPGPSLHKFVDLMLPAGLYITVIAGAAPAFAAGVAAGILRIHIRRLALLACLMAPVGAAVTASYIALLRTAMFEHGVPMEGEVIWTGAVAAFCCTFLLWRNRPWTV
jgi:uncharacterized membrane protein YeaQ/YmgE (transglycosylase-associated protein family)